MPIVGIFNNCVILSPSFKSQKQINRKNQLLLWLVRMLLVELYCIYRSMYFYSWNFLTWSLFKNLGEDQSPEIKVLMIYHHWFQNINLLNAFLSSPCGLVLFKLLVIIVLHFKMITSKNSLEWRDCMWIPQFFKNIAMVLNTALKQRPLSWGTASEPQGLAGFYHLWFLGYILQREHYLHHSVKPAAQQK